MKKIILLFLIFILSASFAACDDRISKISEKVNEADSDSIAEITVDEQGETAEEPEAEPEEKPEKESDKKNLVSNVFGTVEEEDSNAYENEFINIGFELPDDGWVFYDKEQIAELNNLTEEILGKENQEIFDGNTTVQVMHAQNAIGANVNILVEKLDGVNTVIDEKQYRKLATAGMEDAYKENLGATSFKKKDVEVKVDGEKMIGIDIEFGNGDVIVYQRQFYKKIDSYIMVATITAHSEDEREDLGSCFYFLK